MSKKNSKRIELGAGEGEPGLTHSPFASLKGTLGKVESTGSGQSGSAQDEPTQQQPAQEDRQPSRDHFGGTVIVRHERKGHGGKTVTVADLGQTEWAAKQDLDQVAKALRKALGAGARAGEQSITVQGDQVERVAAFFKESYGAQVTLGTR